MKHLAYLSLGTNLGNKEENLNTAVSLIKEQVGDVFLQSAPYVSEPWGFCSENCFLNNVLALHTEFTPRELLEATQQIERLMGRNHKSVDGQYEDRLIDIDILFYDALVMESSVLTIPHPLLHHRLFVLRPLAEIAPALCHPVLGKDIRELLDALLESENEGICKKY